MSTGMTLGISGLTLALAVAATAQPANLLANGGFGEASGATAAEWTLNEDRGGAATARKASGGPDGSPYAEITLQQTGQCDLRPADGHVPTDPDAGYLLTVAIRTSNAAAKSHSAELQWFGEAGLVRRDAVSATVADAWARVAIGPIRTPEGAERVIVLLRCYEPGTYDFASVGLWEVEAIPGNALSNPGFESDGGGDGVPDGWIASETGAGIDAEGAHTGQLCARTHAGASWRQSGVPVAPSTSYELTGATRADDFGRDFRMAIEWGDANGGTIDTKELSDQTWEGWQAKTLRATSPPNATQASVVLENAGEGTVWFDDIALTDSGKVADIDVAIEAPNARGLLREGVDEKTLRVRWAMASDQANLDLVIRVIDSGGGTRAEDRLAWGEGPGVWEPDVSGCEPGAYRVIAEAASGGADAVASADACFDIVPGDAPGMFFRDDHVALVEGEPWFPIGVTSFSPTSGPAERIADAGFNLLVCGRFSNEGAERAQAEMAGAEALGLYVIEWNNGHVYSDHTSEARHELFAESVSNIDGHRRFLGWMCDEAIWNGRPVSAVRDAYLAARAAAPTLVLWQNQAPRNTIEDLADYCRWADVSGMDIYPVEGATHSDLGNPTLSVVGDEMDKQHLTVDSAKPIWAILQGFGWGAWEEDESAHKRAPTWHETRFMAYDAILHGAMGIIYWGAAYEDQDSDIWNSLRRIAGELAELTPALVAEERVEIPVRGRVPVIATGRMVDGKLWVMAVNESDETVDAGLRLPRGAVAFERFAEPGGLVPVRKGKLRDTFEPWAVHVYREP